MRVIGYSFLRFNRLISSTGQRRERHVILISCKVVIRILAFFSLTAVFALLWRDELAFAADDRVILACESAKAFTLEIVHTTRVPNYHRQEECHVTQVEH